MGSYSQYFVRNTYVRHTTYFVATRQLQLPTSSKVTRKKHEIHRNEHFWTYPKLQQAPRRETHRSEANAAAKTRMLPVVVMTTRPLNRVPSEERSAVMETSRDDERRKQYRWISARHKSRTGGGVSTDGDVKWLDYKRPSLHESCPMVLLHACKRSWHRL